MTEINAPIDRTHEECRRAVSWVNGAFQDAKDRAKQWVPRPCPTS